MPVLQCASVYTYELDDPGIALAEINARLAEKMPLLAHSVGIIMCHTEFVTSGIVRHIGERLPFAVAGVTTSSQAVNGEAGEMLLTVFVMTSDDVQFIAGVTDALDDAVDAPVKEAYAKAAGRMSELPKLAVIFPPLILKYAGDTYISAWEQVLPGVPVFGTLAIDDTLTFEGSETIFGGESYKTAMPFVLCYGNINPRFIIGTLPEDKAMPYKGEITMSNGPFVQEINHINAYKYFESIGFASNGILTENFLFVPFLLDQKKRGDYDGIPVIRLLAAFTPEGTAIFRGDVDEGSTFALLTSGADDVLSTTRQKAEQLNAMRDVHGALLFPCIVRRMMTMRDDPLMELKTVKDAICPDIPFMAGYAGGEICPTSVRDGVPVNRFHNYSLVILVV
ncbi:MAG: FIST C-terminal domain-containing protein [Clostridiales bacterium]|nr:FIST C-terminal domain-containing protein [Clostridiales bacterium]